MYAMNRHSVLLILMVIVGLTGCYTFSNSLPGHLRSVNIPVLENETLEATLSEELTTAVTDRFVQGNQLDVVQGTADAILEGRITGYEERVSGFNSQQRADEYLVVVTVDITFRDRVKNKEVWSEENIRGVASYFVGSTDVNTPSSESQAREVALRQIVDIVVSRTFEGW